MVRKMKITFLKGNDFLFFASNILLFFYVYDVYKHCFPTVITSRRMAVLFGGVLLLFKNNMKFRLDGSLLRTKIVRNSLMLNSAVLIYSAWLILFVGYGTGNHIFNDSIVQFYVVFVGSYVFVNLYDDFDKFMEGLLIVSLIQTFFIFCFIFAPSVQKISDNFFEFPEYSTIFRARGYYTGISCAGAPGMFKLIPGLFACIYCLQDKTKSIIKYMFFFLAISAASVLIARTGVVIVGVAFLSLLMTRGKNMGMKHKVIMILMFVFVFCAILSLIYFKGLTTLLSKVLQRLFRLKEVGLYEGFFKFYLGRGEFSNTVLPSISKETIIGTGITSGTSANGITVNMDGGYARLYVALGLPGAIVFYLLFFRNMIHSVRLVPDALGKVLFSFLVICYPLCEFKEYYIYTNYLLCVYITAYYLYFRKKRNIYEI